jgi:hypothetical protein
LGTAHIVASKLACRTIGRLRAAGDVALAGMLWDHHWSAHERLSFRSSGGLAGIAS